MHLLVVEDEDAIRSAMARGLAVRGTTVAAAASLEQARALAAARRPDALVTDLKLPDGTGLELARELGLPFVLMTGYGTFDDAVAAMRLGCLDVFTKPVPIRDLRHAVERIAARLHEGPVVIDGGGPLVAASPREGDVAVQADGAGWADPAGARAAFERLRALAPAVDHRQVLAECLQAVPAGRAVVNLRPGRWLLRVRAAAAPVWSDEVRQVVEERAAAVHWTADGCFVECSHG